MLSLRWFSCVVSAVVMLSSCAVTMNDSGPGYADTSYTGYTVGYGYGNVDSDIGYGSMNTMRGYGGWASSYYSPGYGYTDLPSQGGYYDVTHVYNNTKNHRTHPYHRVRHQQNHYGH